MGYRWLDLSRLKPGILQHLKSEVKSMRVLGIETSCDETGVALYDDKRGLLAERLHSQIAQHADYGGVVPEIASRDHIRRLLPLVRAVLDDARLGLSDLDAIAYTRGPGLAGALLVGSAFATTLAMTLGLPAIGIHHLEGHLLSPLLSANPPDFPFVALLVSGGHTQLMAVTGVGQYRLLGETLDDAAGEAFDKTAKLLGLGYPGGPAVAEKAKTGDGKRFAFPRPMLHSGDLNMSFSGLKTAVVCQANKLGELDNSTIADLCRAFEEAVVEVLVAKSVAALKETGYRRLVVAGGVGANMRLRESLATRLRGLKADLHYPPVALCTDNGAMIALAGSLRLTAMSLAVRPFPRSFAVAPRWPLDMISSRPAS